MRILYFDISGTLLRGNGDAPKRELVGGRLDAAVRTAGFERLVCVSSLVGAIRYGTQSGTIDDPLGVLFRICRGTFDDEDWFRTVAALPENASPRANCIDLEQDWWYVDDNAAAFCADVGRGHLLYEPEPRVFEPSPRGDGADIIEWLSAIPTPPQR